MSASFPVTDDTRWRISTAVAGQTVFSVPFPFQERGDVVVWKQSVGGLITVLTLDVHYTIVGAGNPAGGTVTLTAGAAAGEKIYRIGQATLDRLTSVVRNGKFSSEALDEDLDRTVITLQEFRREVERSWRVGFGQTAGSINIGRPGFAAMYDQNGNISEGPNAEDIVGAQGYAQEAEDAAVAATASATLSARFAIWPEDEDIPGQGGARSSLHYSKKAQASEVAAGNFAAQAAVAGKNVGEITEYEGVLFPGHILYREGGTYNTATYPQLLAYFQTAKANGGFPSLTMAQINAGVLPDYRDYSPRTAGGALGPALGAKQEDAVQGFFMEGLYATNASAAGGANAALATAPSGSPQQGPLASAQLRNRVSDGVNGNPRTASETRGKSFGVRYQIKAFGAAVDQGTVVISALAASVNNLENKAVRRDVDQSAAAFTSAEKAQLGKNIFRRWEDLSYVPSALAQTQLTQSLVGFEAMRFKFKAKPNSGSNSICVELSTDGGASYLASYVVSYQDQNAGTLNAGRNNYNTANLNLVDFTSTAIFADCEVELSDLNTAGVYASIRTDCHYYGESGGIWRWCRTRGVTGALANVNAVRIRPISGTLDFLKVFIQGMRP